MECELCKDKVRKEIKYIMSDSYLYIEGFKDDYILYTIKSLHKMYKEAQQKGDTHVCIMIRTLVHNGLYNKE